MKNLLFLLLLGILFFKCEPPRADLSGYNEEKKSRELKKIPVSQLTSIAHEEALVLADSIISGLPTNSRFEIKKISLDKTSEIAKENLIIEAYQYNHQNGIELVDNEQLIDHKLFLYNRPLVESGQLIGVLSIRINLIDLAKQVPYQE